MNIRKRPSGKWTVQIRMKGQSHTKTFADYKSCVQYGKDIEKRLSSYTSNEVSLSVSVNQLIERYKQEFTIHKRQGANEHRRWAKIQREHPWLVNLTLLEIKPLHFQKYKTIRSVDGHRAFNQDLNLFSVLFKKCIGVWGYPLEQIPTTYIEKMPNNPYGRHRTITTSEYKKIISMTEPYGTFFMTLRNTGLRPYSELLNVKKADVDDYDNIIFVRQSKTNKSRRVPVSDYLMSRLKEIESPTEYLFPLSRYGILSKWRRFIKREKIEEKLEVYDLRREFVKGLVKRRLPVYDIARMTGHSFATANRMIELYSGFAHIRQYGH